MDIDSCYQVGYVIKRHGLKGEVKIHLESALPKDLESIFVEIDNRLIPFFIEDISVKGDLAIIKLEDVETPEQASNLANNGVFLPNSYRPKSSSKSMDYKDLVGYAVHFNAIELGEVKSVNDHALNPLLVVSNGEREMLIPISDYFIKQIDQKKKKVKVELPDGFIEIN